MEEVPRHYAPAALAIAVAAWRVGSDVAQAVQQAGYAWDVAQGLAEYVQSRFFDDTQPTEEAVEEMSGATGARVKRARQQKSEARVAPAVRKYVRKCMSKQLEKKFYQKNHSGVSPTSAGTFYSCGVSEIVQGTSDLTRIGNQVRILKIHGRGIVYDSANPTGNFRILVVRDSQFNGANPAVSDILTNTLTFGEYNNTNVIGHGGSRFEILYDKFISTDWKIAASPTYKFVSFTVRPKCVVTYGASTGAVSDVQKNNVFVLALGFQATTTFSINQTCEFVDE